MLGAVLLALDRRGSIARLDLLPARRVQAEVDAEEAGRTGAVLDHGIRVNADTRKLLGRSLAEIRRLFDHLRIGHIAAWYGVDLGPVEHVGVAGAGIRDSSIVRLLRLLLRRHRSRGVDDEHDVGFGLHVIRIDEQQLGVVRNRGRAREKRERQANNGPSRVPDELVHCASLTNKPILRSPGSVPGGAKSSQLRSRGQRRDVPSRETGRAKPLRH